MINTLRELVSCMTPEKMTKAQAATVLKWAIAAEDAASRVNDRLVEGNLHAAISELCELRKVTEEPVRALGCVRDAYAATNCSGAGIAGACKITLNNLLKEADYNRFLAIEAIAFDGQPGHSKEKTLCVCRESVMAAYAAASKATLVAAFLLGKEEASL